MLVALLAGSVWNCTPKTQGNQTKEPISKIVAGYDKLTTPALKAPLAKAIKKGWKPVPQAQIDAQINALKKNLYPVQGNTYYYSRYVTGSTKSKLTFYRVFGNKARLGGSYVSSQPVKNKVQVQKDNALLSEWGNSVEWEAKIEVPSGTIVSVGVVGPQVGTSTPQFLPGGADQILLPFNWLSNTSYNVAVRKLNAKGKPASNFKSVLFDNRAALQKAIQDNDKSAIKRIMGLE